MRRKLCAMYWLWRRHRRTGRGGQGGAAVCGHEFWQRVEIIRAKHITCLKNTNVGSVTGVNGKKTGI